MIPQITRLWDYVGTAWDSFENKDVIETFWLALLSGHQHIMEYTGNVQFSRTIDMMYPTYDYGPENYMIVYSGAIEDLTVGPIKTTVEQVLNGGFEISTSGWSYNAAASPFSRSNTVVHGGSWALKIPGTQRSNDATYVFGGTQRGSSTLTAWVYIASGYLSTDFGSVGMAVQGPIKKSFPKGTKETPLATDFWYTATMASVLANLSIPGWQKLTMHIQAGNITQIQIVNTTNKDIYLDDVSFKTLALFEYPLPDFTYSVPTLTYKYTYNGVVYSGIYTQDVDYVMSAELNSLAWVGSGIVPDQRFTNKGVLMSTADHVYRINPVLGHVWAKQCGFNIPSMYSQYRAYGQDKYTHLKQFIWSLDYYQNQAPNITTLKNAYGVARGLPFAYESGLMSYSLISGLYTTSIGGYSHIFPSGVMPLASGYYNKFSVLVSGLDLYDYTTNPALIDSYTNVYTRRSTLVYKVSPTLSGISFSQDFLDSYTAKIMPEQIQYLIK